MFGQRLSWGMWIALFAGSLVLGACQGAAGGTKAATGSTVAATNGTRAVADRSGDALCAASGTTLSIVAQGNKFDRGCLLASAGKTFAIAFTNEDKVAHNLVVLRSETSTEVLAKSDIVIGSESVTVNVPALVAGTYFFYCEFHPTDMRGTLVVR